MSYGLATRAISAPIGVTQINRFGQLRNYVPLSQFFLQQGGKSVQKGEVLTGKSEPEPSKPKKKRKKKVKGSARAEAMLEGALDPQKCKYCDDPATKAVVHSNAYAYVGVCDKHLGKAKKVVGGEFCYTQLIPQKGSACELCDRPASYVVTKRGNGASGSTVRVCCQAHLKQVRGEVNNSSKTSKYGDPHVKRLKHEEIELNEAKQCRFCKKTATSSPGGVPCCDSHKKLGARAGKKRKAEEKGNSIALLLKGKDEAAAGPGAGMTGTGNVATVAVPLGGDLDPPRKRKRKKKGELSKGIEYLLRRKW